MTGEAGDVHKLKRLAPVTIPTAIRETDQVNERLQPFRPRAPGREFEHAHARATEQSDRSAIGGFVAADSGLSSLATGRRKLRKALKSWRLSRY